MINQFYKQYIERVENYEEGKLLAKERLKALHIINGTCVDAEIFGKDFVKQTFIEIANREIERLEKSKKIYVTSDKVVSEEGGPNLSELYNEAIKDQLSYWKHNKQLIEQHD